MRGEYNVQAFILWAGCELPPRARRILQDEIDRGQELGTTSACAENTIVLVAQLNRNRNYLRVRGEYTRLCKKLSRRRELPPRARRIRIPVEHNTNLLVNYLRVRGEYSP